MKKALSIIVVSLITTISFSQGVKIGSNAGAPDNSSLLEIESNTKGFLPPRMTAVERSNIAAPANGLHIFNTTTGCPEYFNNGQWYSMCGVCPTPASPAAGSHIPSDTQITWNWNSVSGATGYKWGTTNNYASATDIGNVTSYSQSGIGCNSSYSLYVWSYSGCGASANPTQLSQSTSACPWSCGQALTVNHVAGDVSPVNKTVNYGTVTSSLSGSSKCWITQNLGSDQQATSALDATEASAGWYWQFNRKQGYKHDGSTRTPNTSWTSVISESSAWVSSQDPCTLTLGTGWRIPTSSEWTSADATGGWSNENNAYASILKLHAGGGIVFDTDGTYGLGGYYTSFWTSTDNDNLTAYRLKLLTGECIVDNTRNKSHGFHLRCLKD